MNKRCTDRGDSKRVLSSSTRSQMTTVSSQLWKHPEEANYDGGDDDGCHQRKVNSCGKRGKEKSYEQAIRETLERWFPKL